MENARRSTQNLKSRCKTEARGGSWERSSLVGQRSDPNLSFRRAHPSDPTNDGLAVPDPLNAMQAHESPSKRCQRRDGLAGHEAIWMSAARSRITQLDETQIPFSKTRHATFESIDAAEISLSEAQAALYARLKAEEDTIEAAKEEVRKAYAVKYGAMSAARRALRQQRNALPPVARLPPETLRNIFAFCSEVDEPWIEKGPGSYLGWLAVTHVCQRWRDVALSHTGLWAEILHSLGCGWTEAFAERAQMMPLLVHLDAPYPSDWRIQFITKNISRTAYLEVDVDFSEDYSSAFSTGAPLLHTLKVNICGQDPLPDDFLGRHAPALRSFHYSTYDHIDMPFMPLTFLIFARLTSLHVVNSYDPENLSFSELLDGLLDGLEEMHELEELNITLFCKNEDILASEDPIQQRSVTLSKLAYLELTTSMREATMIISHLSLPAHAVACYNMKLSAGRVPDGFFPLILASVHCHADSAAQSSNAITSLHIGTVNSGRATIIRVVARTDRHTDEPDLIVSFVNNTSSARIALEALASTHLKELTLDCVVLKDCTWPDMPALRRLVVEGAAAASLCANLDSVPAVLPALAVLVLVDVGIPAELGSGETEGEMMWLLPRTLAARADAGCRLEVLDVTRCDVDPAWVVHARELLSGTGVRVEWDEDA
ncbi:hypothetical protein FA95DRAFT_1572960 [Auriscalpium vulgare]|uniref:Uncharacterized protein n=1 Tax=Auriscalpium vulgare TaxID=40419 RepID=A0ACB8RSN9_9AGAM|nr:hypothetical protein FA95DRAFT_1572960 [Auriscalpium vulgare]